MSSPTPSVTRIQYRGRIVDPETDRPAKGHVRFEIPQALRDTADHVVLAPKTWDVKLDGNGEFRVWLHPTDHQHLTPSGWTYTVTVLTDVWQDRFQLSVPAATSGALEMSNTAPSLPVPPVVTYALASELTQFLRLSGGVMVGPLTLAGPPTAPLHAATKAYVDSMAGAGGAVADLTLVNVEDYGATGDGVTDDYEAIREAWDVVCASRNARLYFPRPVTYRVLATLERLGPHSGSYALFPIPLVPTETTGVHKKVIGILGVGDPYVVRSSGSFGEDDNAQQVATASVLLVDYETPFGWSNTHGHPSVFATPDADITGHTADNIVSNVHFVVDGMILRQPDNPSMCNLNLELVSTRHTRAVRHDVVSVLDRVPEPTHPTGVAELGPKSNNNVANAVESFVAEGYYAGLPYTEHCDVTRAIVLCCKIAVHNRRQCSHAGFLGMLKLEQCQFQMAGYNPQGTPPNLGVVPWIGGTLVASFVDVEHYGYGGRADNPMGKPWTYTPLKGCTIYAPNGGLTGSIRGYYEIDSEPVPPTGIGLGQHAGNEVYLLGNTNGGLGISGFGIYNLAGEPVEVAHRHLGTAPANPATAPPNTPTIGAATAGDTSVTVTFTPAGSGQPATGFTATAYNGSGSPVGSVAGSASPLTVAGLAAGVEVTVKVRATNAAGSSAESAASNAVTPTSGDAVEHRIFPELLGAEPVASVTDGAAINVGIRVNVTETCQAVKLHFFRPDLAVTGPITGRIWRMSDQQVVPGSEVTFTLSGTGWQTATLSSPVTLTPGRYVIAINFPDRFALTTAFWDSGLGGGGLISGPLTAFSTNDSVGGQGAFASGNSSVYPGGNGGGSNYWVDVTVVIT